MRKIGILCASDTELAPFLRRILPVPKGGAEGCETEGGSVGITEKAMLKFYEGYLGGTRVTVLYSGVCKVNAAIAAQLLIDRFQVDGIINAGTAGGMDRRVRLFDTVISERMVYHDVAEDILTEFHPWLKENCFRAEPKFLAAARKYSEKTAFPLLFGTMATGEQFIEEDRREEIIEKFAPLSVDMETTAAAQVCHANGIPFISIRTITDTAENMGESCFEQNCEAASERAAQVTLGLLEELKALE